jgi:hypothetical protein
MDSSSIIALAAFVISLATLYLGLLRPAEISVERSEGLVDELRFTSRGPVPVSSQVRLVLQASNFGAHSGVLERVSARWISYEGEGRPIWTGVDGSLAETIHAFGTFQLPAPLQPSDITVFALVINLSRAQFDEDDLESIAASIRGLHGVTLEFSWTYTRAAGLPFVWPRLPRFLRRHRSQRTSSQRVFVDADRYREECLELWRRKKEWAHLAGAK